MPIYEYQCLSCGRLEEVMQRISEPPLTTCGECGGELKKLVSAPAFQFKGEGWYVTDYGRKGQAEGSKGTASDSKRRDSGDSESKGSDSGDSESKGSDSKSSESKGSAESSSGDSGSKSSSKNDSKGDGGKPKGSSSESSR